MRVTAIIEMPKGTSFKYEVDKETGKLRIDRPLNIAVPQNYGYIKGTLAGDGDPLDIFVITDEPIQAMTEVEVEIISGFDCVDGGRPDEKLVARVAGDKNSYYDRSNWDIKHYLSTYKEGFKILSLLDKEQAIQVLEKNYESP